MTARVTKPSDSDMHRIPVKAEQYPSAIMSIDLNLMERNLIQCRTHLQASTRIMLVLKAHAYGTRVRETTQWIQRSGQVDYIVVAFVEEGIEMRGVGITLPIMVMNVDPSAFHVCRQFQLEPVIYSLSFLEKLLQWLDDDQGKF